MPSGPRSGTVRYHAMTRLNTPNSNKPIATSVNSTPSSLREETASPSVFTGLLVTSGKLEGSKSQH